MKQFFEKKLARNNVRYKMAILNSAKTENSSPVVDNEVVADNKTSDIEATAEKKKKTNNKNNKKNNDMTIDEQISTAENIVDTMEKPVKVVKKERGLIERCESSKIILTEDNRQVLND